MSKSEGNFIALNDSSKEMFGKTMALPDEVIIPCFELCTELSLQQIQQNKFILVK
jgi:tyrosyl-tRNA synthetase